MKDKKSIYQTGIFHIPVGRRRFFKSMALASGGFMLPGYLAEALTISPNVTQGPYYPLANNVPLDKDNDLIYLNDSLSAATGLITYVTGRVLDPYGNPISGALVELWHADNGGNYIYSNTASRNASADVNFQGFGQFLTGSSGQYKFRTVKAGLYNGRTRHYHLAVTVPGQLTRYCTQLFWNEVPKDSSGNTWSTTNANDMVLTGITDATQRASVILNYSVVDAATGAVGANYDFVPNISPVEPSYPGGSFLVAGTPVAGPTNSTRFMITIPAYTNYTYEVYGNPTLANVGNTITNLGTNYLTDMSWAALPFALAQTGAINTNKITASSNGSLNIYLAEKAVKGFYYVSFRVPGANTGTP